FPVVCGDFSFYQFPGPDDWRRLFGGTPGSLHFGFKVPEEITVAVWPSHARYGPRAGQANGSFLDAGRFDREFARALDPYRDRVAPTARPRPASSPIGPPRSPTRRPATPCAGSWRTRAAPASPRSCSSTIAWRATRRRPSRPSRSAWAPDEHSHRALLPEAAG